MIFFKKLKVLGSFHIPIGIHLLGIALSWSEMLFKIFFLNYCFDTYCVTLRSGFPVPPLHPVMFSPKSSCRFSPMFLWYDTNVLRLCSWRPFQTFKHVLVRPEMRWNILVRLLKAFFCKTLVCALRATLAWKSRHSSSTTLKGQVVLWVFLKLNGWGGRGGIAQPLGFSLNSVRKLLEVS